MKVFPVEIKGSPSKADINTVVVP